MRLRWIGIGVVCFVWAGCSSLQPVGSPGETTTATDGTVEDCTDGVDNELDGLVDCQDDDCASVCDVDGDGHVDIALGGDDCDDNNGAVFPGNTEVCDGIDNNCDGLADDEDPNLDPSDAGWYADFDGDGFGNPNQVTYQCDPPAGAAVQNGDDCDDSDPDIHPNANEICNGQDDNCDGLTDDDDPTVDPLTMRSFWADTDADGLGDPLAGADACIPPANHVENDLDCDDTDPNVGEATEWYFDGDGDGFGAGAPQGPQCTSPGFGYVNMGEDCDDTSAVVYPGAYDLCGDGIDADCNGDDCGGCGAPFDDPSYSADVVFADTLPGTTMTLTWDGSEYWTSSGGGAGGDRLSRYDAAGALQQIYQPGYDWRAVFVKEVGVGPVYGRAFGNTQIVVMTSPGVFSNDVNLVGGVLDAQSAISFDETRREFVALEPGGSVQRWDEGGAFVSSVSLQGFGTQGTENVYPQHRGVAWACDHYLTYSDGILSAWDPTTGVRVATTVLTGAGQSFDSYFSLSYAEDRVFIVDVAGGMWRGFPVF